MRGRRPRPGDFQQEERLRAIRSRLAVDPGAARRTSEYRRIAAAIRPILPALARAVERQATAAADLGKAVVILGEKMRARAEAAAARALANERSRIAGAAINAGKAAAPERRTRSPRRTRMRDKRDISRRVCR